MTVRLDGIRMKVEKVDIDGDGYINEVESVKSHQDGGMIQLKDTSELGEVIGEINKDVENERGFSSVDFISQINEFQLASLVAAGFISRGRVISKSSSDITIDVMRKSPSLQGKRAQQIVDMTVGKKEQDARKGSVQNLAGAQK